MSRTIELDDDVYQFLQRNVRDFGETVSAVVRRLHRLPEPKNGLGAARQSSRPAGTRQSPLTRLLTSRSFSRRSATDKFLQILSIVHKDDPTKFTRVLEISGRRRKYFGRSREEIEKSGKSTHPQLIPASRYWAMTNADTRQKCDLLRRVLEDLGYSADDIRAVDEAVS